MGGKTPHDFKIEQWERGGTVRCFAICDNLSIAHAAYAEACKQYPQYEITLRHGIQVIREYQPSVS